MPRVRHQITACDGPDRRSVIRIMAAFVHSLDVEFKMDLDVEGVDAGSRDYNVQQHKAEVYQEFERRLNNVFPEGIKIDRFEFGLSLDKDS